MIRLNKFITDAGYCSRRDADAYISQCRVTVNGVDAVLGTCVNEGDAVEIDGERVGRKAKNHVYIAFNKPVGVTCTTDRADKTNIIDFINYKERIFPVGRLDKDSNGLIILTNNGDIVNKILRAGNNNPKEYIVTVNKPITSDFLQQMGSGVRILGEKTKRCDVIQRNPSTFTIFLTQGLNRQIRRMCAVLGYTVTALKRVRVMNITLGGLEVGKWRYFTPAEIEHMHALLEESSGTEEASKQRSAPPQKRYCESPHRTSLKSKPAEPAKSKATDRSTDRSEEESKGHHFSHSRSRFASATKGSYNNFRKQSKAKKR